MVCGLFVVKPPTFNDGSVVAGVEFHWRGNGKVERSVCDGRLCWNVVFGQLALSTFRGFFLRGVYG